MKRKYYISDDLDELEHVERELEQSGIELQQIHVLSKDDAGLEQHNLPSVDSLMRKDTIRYGLIGLSVGIIVSALVLVVTFATGFSSTYTWVPGVVFAIIVLGFCTWEGGLWGIQVPRKEFQRFDKYLRDKKHVMFIDVDPEQEKLAEGLLSKYSSVRRENVEDSTSDVLVSSRIAWNKFVKWAP